MSIMHLVLGIYGQSDCLLMRRLQTFREMKIVYYSNYLNLFSVYNPNCIDSISIGSDAIR